MTTPDDLRDALAELVRQRNKAAIYCATDEAAAAFDAACAALTAAPAAPAPVIEMLDPKPLTVKRFVHSQLPAPAQPQSMLRKPVSSIAEISATIPGGCYCPPDKCGAPVIMGMQTPCLRRTAELEAALRDGKCSHKTYEAALALDAAAPAQPAEPVAWRLPKGTSFISAAAKKQNPITFVEYTDPLYAAPPPPPQPQPLTDERVWEIWEKAARISDKFNEKVRMKDAQEVVRAVLAAQQEQQEQKP
jgi:hypothetical protein